jgi:hypothetical protein
MAEEDRRAGPPTLYKPEYAEQARKLCQLVAYVIESDAVF